jgi:hypothetical protein
MTDYFSLHLRVYVMVFQMMLRSHFMIKRVICTSSELDLLSVVYEVSA